MVQITFIMIGHEILSTVIHTVPMLWYVQKLSVPRKSEGNLSTSKLLDSLLKNNEVAELCSGELKLQYLLLSLISIIDTKFSFTRNV
jgi:hypothetical protein